MACIWQSGPSDKCKFCGVDNCDDRIKVNSSITESMIIINNLKYEKVYDENKCFKGYMFTPDQLLEWSSAFWREGKKIKRK